MNRMAVVTAGLAVMAWLAVYAASGQDGRHGPPGPGGEVRRDAAAPVAPAGPAGRTQADRGRGPETRRDGERRGVTVQRKLYGEQAKMVEVCGLTEEQQQHVMDLDEARDREIREITARYQAQIVDVLTPEQRAKWLEWTVMDIVQKTFLRAELTPEQLAKVRAAIPTLVPGVLPPDFRARFEALRKLTEFVNKEVLTDHQRRSMYGGGDRRGVQPRREGDGVRPAEPRTEGDRPGAVRPPTTMGDLPPL